MVAPGTKKASKRASAKPDGAETNERLNAKALKRHNPCINSFLQVFLGRLSRFLDVVSLLVFLMFLFSLAALRTVKVIFFPDTL